MITLPKIIRVGLPIKTIESIKHDLKFIVGFNESLSECKILKKDSQVVIWP